MLRAALVLCTILFWTAPAGGITQHFYPLLVNATTNGTCTGLSGPNVFPNAAGKPGSACPLDVTGFTTGGFQVEGTFGTATVFFEANNSGSSAFYPIECFRSEDRTASAASTTTAGGFRCSFIGLHWVQARVATSSGPTNITVWVSLVSAGVT